MIAIQYDVPLTARFQRPIFRHYIKLPPCFPSCFCLPSSQQPRFLKATLSMFYPQENTQEYQYIYLWTLVNDRKLIFNIR